MAATILWFRRNLRTTDNRALQAAIERGQPVIPVYVSDELDEGGASRWWLHHSLVALESDLRSLGSRLVIRRGDPGTILKEIVLETGATSICYSKRYEPAARRQEERVAELADTGITILDLDDQYLNTPTSVYTGSGKPYKVFTPFWRASLERGEPDVPAAAATELRPWPGDIETLNSADLGMLPVAPDWAAGLRETWAPGERGALARLDQATEVVSAYDVTRDRPDIDQTSRLSPHLHFGEVSPRQVWHALRPCTGSSALLRQLYWREFSTYLLYHYPSLESEPLRTEFEFFPWADDSDGLRAWQRGKTGYPIVDAGMRQLYRTGWMHNRVRMIAASFLVKDLLIPWQEGAAWFNDTLVDADTANNSASWQWVAGCGTDAAPYFRIFNPTTQQEKFDPDGNYVRRWIPELGTEAYPAPVVDHAVARRRALAAYHETRDLLKSRAG